MRPIVAASFLPFILGLYACSGAPSSDVAQGQSAQSADITEGESPAEMGFVPPTFDIDVATPPALPGIPSSPPTIDNVTVKTGLDGRTPEQVIGLVESKLTNTIAPENKEFVDSTIRTTQKYFTIAVNNVFTPGSPPARFVKIFPTGTPLSIVGTMSAVHPDLLRADLPGNTAPQYFAWDGATYQPLPSMKYPIIMECKLRLQPAGVMLHYSAWSAPVLSGPTSTVTEGP